MSDPSRVILAGVIAALRDSTAVAAAFPGDVQVWETVPPAEGADDLEYPFIRVGEIQVVADERIENEVDGDEPIVDDPSEVFVTLHAFSRPRNDGGGGKPEAMALLGAARRVLAADGELELEADDDGALFALVLSEIRDTRHFTDPDGLTAHSVMTARFELEPAETG